MRALVLTKLQAVGLRGAAELMPAELSGGMARRVALARAIVMDPELLIYDEPFVGLDPISSGVIVRLIQPMNEALGITSIVVSHDVLEISRDRARQLSALRRQGGGCGHSPGAQAKARSTSCGSSWRAAPRVRCRFTIRRRTTRPSCSRWRTHERGAWMNRRGRASAAQARRRRGFLLRAARAVRAGAGAAAAHRQSDLQRRRALAGHHHALGLFVGMVLGLQGFELLQRFGSEDALGVAAALWRS